MNQLEISQVRPLPTDAASRRDGIRRLIVIQSFWFRSDWDWGEEKEGDSDMLVVDH